MSGERIYNGMPIGSELGHCGISDCSGSNSPYFYPFIWAFGKDYNGYNFDFNRDLKALNEKLAPYLNANSADLKEFDEKGGKLIMYSGSADACVPFPDALNYYLRVCEKTGGTANSFVRYFVFPGMDHGRGGNGVNEVWTDFNTPGTLSALRKWREEGKAPDKLCGVSYINKNRADGIKFAKEIPCYSEENRIDCPPACSKYYLENKEIK